MVDVVPEAFVRRVLETLTPWECGSDLVRLGPDGDGGYLVPEAHLDGIGRVMSAGLGLSSGFEDAVLDRVGTPASIVDGSMDRPNWLASAHRFHRRWLAGSSDDDHWSLDDWVEAEAAGSDDLLLQMDIEGAEYRVLAAARPSTLARFRVIVVELHRLGLLLHPTPFAHIAPVLSALAEQFVAVHLHPNNCCGTEQHGELTIPNVVEATWVRRTALPPEWRPVRLAPLAHPLDRPNVTGSADIELWTGWPAPRGARREP